MKELLDSIAKEHGIMVAIAVGSAIEIAAKRYNSDDVKEYGRKAIEMIRSIDMSTR